MMCQYMSLPSHRLSSAHVSAFLNFFMLWYGLQQHSYRFCDAMRVEKHVELCILFHTHHMYHEAGLSSGYRYETQRLSAVAYLVPSVKPVELI